MYSNFKAKRLSP
jgi:hypothetical protein